ncbi:MAG: CotH kinase family protein [Prolixibacteraceae bacterium]
MLKFSLISFLLAFFAFQISGQTLRINEVMSSNGGVLPDADGDTPDWIEIYNFGNDPVNLNGYGLSDKKDELFQWVFPDFQLKPKEYLVVFASGKDRHEVPLFWNTIINQGDSWKYLVPSSEPVGNWRLASFFDSNWNSGKSGFGFGDNDDATNVTVNRSIFLRKKFTIENVLEIKQLVLHMDYDDGFVAYLNGVEIARSQMAGKGELPGFGESASDQHEALVYQGLAPEKFDVENPASILKNGENILTVQVHNVNTTSSDLSAIPFLTVGTATKPASQQLVPLLNMGQHEFHTNFRISGDGESVYLTNPDGANADSVQIPALAMNTSYGRRNNDQDSWVIYASPTPGELNPETAISQENVGVPIFSKPGHVSKSGLSLILTAPNGQDTIYYTMDGSEPTKSSYKITGKIDIRSTQVIRARIIRSGIFPGKVITNSYIVYDNKNLPIVSLSMNPSDLWDYNTGIYVKGPNAEAANPNFGANFWQDWEKACHFELLENTGDKVIDVDAGIKIYGNWSRANAQKSMALYCRKSYGPELMKYKIFRERPFDEFKNLVLRNSGNDWNQSMFRDGLMTGLTLELGLDFMAYRPSTVFLNGEYWGILNIREKINENYLAANHGVDPNKVVLLENNASPIIGTADEYLSLYSFIETNSLVNQSNYDKVASQIDVENFINYFASQIYFRNHDWPGNNIKYWKTTDPGSRWRWLLFDTDFGMGIWNSPPTENSLAAATATDGPGWPNPPWSTLILRKLLENSGFRNQFINQFADLLNSTFSGERVNQAIDLKSAAISGEIGYHLARWAGGNANGWSSGVQKMKYFATERPANVFNHIRQKFNFSNPQLVVVRTDSLMGYVQLNSLKLTNYPWMGSYFKEVPITLTAVPRAGYRFLKWEGVTNVGTSATITVAPFTGLNITAVFESDGSHYDDVVINEISVNNSATQDPGDWIEIYNKGQFDLDISGWKLTDSDPDHQFIFAAGTILKANEYLVVCNDLIKMKSVFGELKNLLDPFVLNFGLSNKGDDIKLFSRQEQLIDEVNYGNDIPWPTYSLDELWSLELGNPASENNSGINWVLSVNSGTPGLRNSSYITSAKELTADITNKPELWQNYPNPFTDGTYIEFNLVNPEKYKISVLDVNGRVIRIFSDDSQLSTVHTLYWDGKDNTGKPVVAGVYFYRLECEGFTEMKRMVKI